MRVLWACVAISAVVLVSTPSAATMFLLQEEVVIEGVLSGVDTESMTLTIKTVNGEEVRVKYRDDMKIAGLEETIPSLKEKVGVQVKINYKLVDDMPEAVRVEIVNQ